MMITALVVGLRGRRPCARWAIYETICAPEIRSEHAISVHKFLLTLVRHFLVEIHPRRLFHRRTDMAKNASGQLDIIYRNTIFTSLMRLPLHTFPSVQRFRPISSSLSSHTKREPDRIYVDLSSSFRRRTTGFSNPRRTASKTTCASRASRT